MPPRVDPVLTTSELPAEADVVVIGGGIIGACTSLCLAERGVSVALCEKGAIAGEQSSRNWGWCRKMGRDLAEVPLAVESLRLWGALNADQCRDRVSQDRRRLSLRDVEGSGKARGVARTR
jgi:glycine/D-amino acid oxidase-like deaminating enzyme